jgi:hypothetical protein
MSRVVWIDSMPVKTWSPEMAKKARKRKARKKSKANHGKRPNA